MILIHEKIMEREITGTFQNYRYLNVYYSLVCIFKRSICGVRLSKPLSILILIVNHQIDYEPECKIYICSRRSLTVMYIMCPLPNSNSVYIQWLLPHGLDL